MDAIFNPEIIASFITLSLLEIVLGIDNLIFIALVVDKLPMQYRKKARIIGLSLALIIRVMMLFGVSWIMTLTEPLFTIYGHDISFKDLLLIAGGLFLIVKATLEMHGDVLGLHSEREVKARSTFRGAIIQITLIDIVFSFDSIITAVGLAPNVYVIIGAVVVSMIVMLMASGYISQFLSENPTFKMLALSFILMIGTLLVAEGFHYEVPKGYVYFALGFSCFVEALNTIAKRKQAKHEKI